VSTPYGAAVDTAAASPEPDCPLSGDLARLASWWHEHRPREEMQVHWLEPTGDETDVIAALDRMIDAGSTLIVIQREGNNEENIAARATIARITRSDAAAVFAQPPEMDDLTWMRSVAAIRDARAEGTEFPLVTALASAFIRCSERRTPVLFDGVIAHAAALQAGIEEPGIGQWWLPAASCTDPAIDRARADMANPPALDLHLDGRGTAGLRAVLAVLTELAQLAELELPDGVTDEN